MMLCIALSMRAWLAVLGAAAAVAVVVMMSSRKSSRGAGRIVFSNAMSGIFEHQGSWQCKSHNKYSQRSTEI